MPPKAAEVVARLLARGSDHWSDECAGVGYDPASPSYAEPVTRPETLLVRTELQQWIYLIEAAEQVLRLASLLVDPRRIEGETLDRLWAVLRAPAYESKRERIDREQLLRSARQNVELAWALQDEIVALQGEIDGGPRTTGTPVLSCESDGHGLDDQHATAEGQIHRLLATEGPQTSAQIARNLGGLTSQRVAQICSYSDRIEHRRRAGRSHGIVWGAATNDKPRATRRPR